MPMAARLPAPSARATVRSSPATSPPAKSAPSAVAPHSSTTMPPSPTISCGQALSSGSSPVAMSTLSAETKSDSPVAIGRGRPSGPGSPSAILAQATPLSRPSSERKAVGAARKTNSTPSRQASSTSSGMAGIWSRVRR